ncbi:MAG: single-stranded DNA-binding protein [Methylocella sp.]
MSGVNKVILVGRLGRDPEVRRTNAGGAVVTFSIATSDTWRDKVSGERKERVEWHNIVIFNENLGKVAESYLKKGSQAYVEGKLRTRSYTDKDGGERRTTEVVLEQFGGQLALLDKGERTGPSADSYGTVSDRPARPAQQHDDPRMAMGDRPTRTADIIDDDIPF